MRRIDELYTEWPYYGSRRITHELNQQGWKINRKRVQRLMQRLGLEAIYPKPRLSTPAAGHKIYPYLLRGVKISRPDQVWSTDITYIRLHGGFIYLVAVIDWYSRYVLSWEVSVNLDTSFCISALEWALKDASPEIFNTDQGSQFTSEDFTTILKDRAIQISMDGRGRALDNVFVERLWRSVKWEEVYLKDYSGVEEAIKSLARYFQHYNHRRPHQALGYKTPADVYFEGKKDAASRRIA
jgi:putative transposase